MGFELTQPFAEDTGNVLTRVVSARADNELEASMTLMVPACGGIRPKESRGACSGELSVPGYD